MALKAFLIGLLVALVQFFLGLVFSVTALSAGLSLLDRLTRGYEEWELIKKGNVAVGVLYGMVALSIIIIIEPSLVATVLAVHAAMLEAAWLAFLLHLLVFVIALLMAVLSIYTSLRVINSITADVDEFGAIMKGNVSMAVLVGCMVLGVSFVIRTAIIYLVAALTAAM